MREGVRIERSAFLFLSITLALYERLRIWFQIGNKNFSC